MSHIVISDPNDISSRFSNSDKLGYEEENAELESMIERDLAPKQISEESLLEFDAISEFLTRIPIREADLITLYYRDKLKQEQIAKLFGITQAAVSYRLSKGIKRIQWLRTIPTLDKEDFESELGPEFSQQDLEILWRMNEVTCQSKIAKEMGLTQGRVRHRFFRALQKIKDLIKEEAKEKQVEIRYRISKGEEISKEDVDREINEVVENSKFGKYWTVYFAISDRHFNILHEVTLPQFVNRGDAEIIDIER